MHLDQPLSDAEFDELDDFLLSDRCADDVMTMDTLHGYLTALAIGPQEVLMAEWLPRVWGSRPETPQVQEWQGSRAHHQPDRAQHERNRHHLRGRSQGI
jgi:uncharacterized protein YecA (UPF0149 family)